MLLAAVAGVWLFWSQYSQLSTLDWWYESVRLGKTSLVNPDYDLASLPWQRVAPRVFDLHAGTLTLITDAQPYAYQAYATVNTNGARAADIQFDIDIESGGTTIGLLQAGRWVATTSSQHTGAFSDSNTALLGYRRSITVVIANDNPAGETQMRVKSLRLYLRR